MDNIVYYGPFVKIGIRQLSESELSDVQNLGLEVSQDGNGSGFLYREGFTGSVVARTRVGQFVIDRPINSTFEKVEGPAIVCESFASKAIFSLDLVEPFDYGKLKPTSSKILMDPDLWYTMFDLQYSDCKPAYTRGTAASVKFYLVDGKHPARTLDIIDLEGDDGSRASLLKLADTKYRKEDVAWVPYKDAELEECTGAQSTYRPLTVLSSHVYEGVFQRSYEYAAARFAKLYDSERLDETTHHD